MADNRSRSYEDFKPSTQWISDDNSETLLIRLPAGFSKENLKVQMDNLGNLRAIGERPLEAGRGLWSRFQTEHPIPKSCDVRGVRARFDNNILNITFPKLITEEPKPSTPPTPKSKPEPEPMPEPEKKPPVAEQKREEDEEVKDKEEKEHNDVDNDEKEKKDDMVAPKKKRIWFMESMMRPRQLVVNMFVAMILIVVIGMYLRYKFRRGTWEPSWEELLNVGRVIG